VAIAPAGRSIGSHLLPVHSLLLVLLRWIIMGCILLTVRLTAHPHARISISSFVLLQVIWLLLLLLLLRHVIVSTLLRVVLLRIVLLILLPLLKILLLLLWGQSGILGFIHGTWLLLLLLLLLLLVSYVCLMLGQ